MNEYPTWLYRQNAAGEVVSKQVHGPAEHDELGNDWVDSPAKARGDVPLVDNPVDRPAAAVVSTIVQSSDADEITAIVEAEAAGKNRKSVMTAAERRLEELLSMARAVVSAGLVEPTEPAAGE